MAVGGMQLLPVQMEQGMKLHVEGIVQIQLQLLLLGELQLRVVFRSQVPFFQKVADCGMFHPHTEVHHNPLSAEVDRWDHPVGSGPVEFLAEGQFFPGAPPTADPEFPLKGDFPFG